MDVAFFVTGHGRSGTQWLARLLDKSPGIRCYHEPMPDDIGAYARIYRHDLDAETYLRERATKMHAIWHQSPAESYAEVSSYLRYCVPELREVFGVPVVGLIRDGRYVVRSMLARGVYGRPNYPPIPAQGDHPFAKAAWYWAGTYSRFRDLGMTVYRLEDLNANYGEYESLCEDLRIRPDMLSWARYSGMRVNVGVDVTSPPAWEKDVDRIFMEIAGDIYSYYGYKAKDENCHI